MDQDSPEEVRKVAPLLIGIFGAVYGATLLLNLGIVAALMFAGRQMWSWWWVLPVGALALFAARVFKRVGRNMLDSVQDEIRRATEEAIAPAPQETPALPDTRTRVSRPRAVGLLCLTMLSAAGFWFAIGWLSTLAWP